MIVGMVGAVVTGEAGADVQEVRKRRRKTLVPHASAGEKEGGKSFSMVKSSLIVFLANTVFPLT